MNKIYKTITRTGTFSMVLFLISALTLLGQTPSTFNYQAVLRDASGEILESTSASIQLVIHQGTSTGTTVYSEVHNTTTNEFGLVNLEIGSVTPASFGTIDWSAGPYFVEVIVNGAAMGASELLTVPYALYASNGVIANSVGSSEVIDNSLTEDDLAPNSVGTSELDASAFSNWDQDESDDFDGNYSSLSGAPTNVSSFTNDAGYLTSDVDNRTLHFPAQALSKLSTSTIITDDPLGLLWQHDYANGAYLIVRKPSNYSGGDVTFSLFFETTTPAAGIVNFFIRPRSASHGNGLVDGGAINGTNIGVSGTSGFGTLYEQNITIPSNRLTNDWWIITIQREGTGSTYADDIRLLSVALTY